MTLFSTNEIAGVVIIWGSMEQKNKQVNSEPLLWEPNALWNRLQKHNFDVSSTCSDWFIIPTIINLNLVSTEMGACSLKQGTAADGSPIPKVPN